MYSIPRSLNLTTNIEEIKNSYKRELAFLNTFINSDNVGTRNMVEGIVAAKNFIEKSQLTILLLKGLIGTITNPEESNDFSSFLVSANLKETDNFDQVIHEHYCFLIDLKSKLKELKNHYQTETYMNTCFG